MEFPRLDAVRAALSTLDATGIAMEAVAVPKVFGRKDALASARSLVTLAQSQAEQAATLAREAKLAPESIESATSAVRMLGELPISQDEVRAAGTQVRSMVEELRHAEYVGREAAEAAAAAQREAQLVAHIDELGPETIASDLLTRDPGALAPNDWALLAKVASHHADTLGAQVQRTDSEPLALYASELAAGSRRVDNDVRAYFDAAVVARLDERQLVSEASRLLDTPPSQLDDVEWSRLAALLEDTRTAAALPKLPRRIGKESFAKVVRDVAGYFREVDTTVQAAFDKYHVARLSSRELTGSAKQLLSRHSSELEPHEWSRLVALLERDAGAARIAMPRRLGREPSIVTLARQHAEQTRDVDELTQRYFDAWHARSLTPQKLAASADDLLARADELGTDDWARLGAYLDADADGTILRVPRELPGVAPLRELVSDGASGYADVTEDVARYSLAGRFARMSPDELAAEARTYLERGVYDLREADWEYLGALVRADHAGASAIPKTLPGTPSFDDLAAGIYEGSFNEYASRYFEHARLARASADDIAAEADELFAIAPEDLEPEDWGRLHALLARDEAATLKGVPRSLDGHAESIDELLDLHARNGLDVTDELRPWFTARHVAGLDDAGRLDEATRILNFQYQEHADADWERLAALLRDPGDGALARMPKELEGDVEPLARVVDDHLAYGGQDDALTRYSHAWQTASFTPAKREAELASLLGRRPNDLADDDWLRLRGLLDGDVERTVTEPIRKLPRTRPFAQLVSEVVASERYADDPQVLRYLGAWRRHDDGAFRAKLEASITALAEGRGTSDDVARVYSQRFRLDELAYGRSAAEQSLIGAAMLEDTATVASLDDIRAALQLIRDNSPQPSAFTGDVRKLSQRTTRLIDRNIERLDGLISDGYDSHPEYAEIGRIRENVKLIQRLRNLPEDPIAAQPAIVHEPVTLDAAGVITPVEGTLPPPIDVPSAADEVKAAITGTDDLLNW